MRAPIAVALLVLTLTAPACAKDKPWPTSECRNGWVDRMTGECPYRGNEVSVAVPEFKAGLWPCPFWRYQQVGQPPIYYSLADPSASVDALCQAESKRQGRE